MLGKKLIIVGVVIIAVSILGFAAYHVIQWGSTPKEAAQNLPRGVVTIKNIPVNVDIASDNDSRSTGLSGRLSLGENEGMFFIFPAPDTYSFWMPDMHFSLDIIWLDASMRVISISKNVSPESYPKLFTPEVPAQFVLEVPAGFADRHQIEKGDAGHLSIAE